MNKPNDVKRKKKSLWAILKESMNKASSGCGPGCGCHVEKKTPEDSGSDKERA